MVRRGYLSLPTPLALIASSEQSWGRSFSDRSNVEEQIRAFAVAADVAVIAGLAVCDDRWRRSGARE